MSTAHNYSGTWILTQWYPNTTDDEEKTAVYRMTAYQRGDKIVLENESESEVPHLTVNLTISESLATGTWAKTTDPTGAYEGITYSGAMQLIIAESGDSMDGKWVGIGRHPLDGGGFEARIYTGRWLMERADDQSGAAAVAASAARPGIDDPATLTGTTES